MVKRRHRGKGRNNSRPTAPQVEAPAQDPELPHQDTANGSEPGQAAAPETNRARVKSGRRAKRGGTDGSENLALYLTKDPSHNPFR